MATSYWNTVVFGGSKAGEMGLDGLRQAVPLGQPLFVEKVSWTASVSNIGFEPKRSTAAVFVWPTHIGLIHVKELIQLDYRMLDLATTAVTVHTPGRGRVRSTSVGRTPWSRSRVAPSSPRRSAWWPTAAPGG